MLMFAYKVGGWVWQNAYVVTRIAKKREGNSEMKEILNYYKKFGEAQKFRSHIGKCLIQDRGQNFFREWVGF